MQPDIPDPRPKSPASIYSPIAWPVADSIGLEPGVAPMVVDLAALLAERRSHAKGTDPSLQGIGATLWHVNRTLSTSPSPYGFQIERRPVPSAGALHPVHILVQLPQTELWTKYDPKRHRLDKLVDTNQVLKGLLDQAQDVAEHGSGSYLAFVGEPGRLAAKYDNYESLLWRDAGVLQGNICLAAHAHGLGVCLLGVTGHRWTSRLAEEGHLVGLGLARIYTRT